MDRSLLFLLIAMVVIFVLFGNATEAFVEGFGSFNDTQQYINSCKSLVKEKAIVDKLISDDKCDAGPIGDFVLPNRDSMNKKLGCKNLTDKKIMLQSEQPSWCGRLGQLDQAKMVVGAPGIVPPALSQGVDYMETQYTSIFGSLAPNDVGSSAYASFADMSLPISNVGLSTI